MLKITISYIEFWQLFIATISVLIGLSTVIWWLARDFKRRIVKELQAEFNGQIYDIIEDVAANETEINHMAGLLQSKLQYNRLLISRPRRKD